MQNTIQSINLIAVNPDIRNGRAHIIGTAVTVVDIAIAKIYHALDADGIADWYGLTLPQVYARNQTNFDQNTSRRVYPSAGKQIIYINDLIPATFTALLRIWCRVCTT